MTWRSFMSVENPHARRSDKTPTNDFSIVMSTTDIMSYVHVIAVERNRSSRSKHLVMHVGLTARPGTYWSSHRDRVTCVASIVSRTVKIVNCLTRTCAGQPSDRTQHYQYMMMYVRDRDASPTKFGLGNTNSKHCIVLWNSARELIISLV